MVQPTQLLYIFTASQPPISPVSTFRRKQKESEETTYFLSNSCPGSSQLSSFFAVQKSLRHTPACTKESLHLSPTQGRLQVQHLECFTCSGFCLPDHFHPCRPCSNSSHTKTNRSLFTPTRPFQ